MIKYLDNNGTQYNITAAKQRLAALTQSISDLADVASGLAAELDGLEDDLGTAASKDVPTSGNASNTEVVLGSDTRLTDSRTPTAHNQDSSTINAMTGYSKPQSYSAITTSDTLNQAVGKLEASLGDINSVLEEVL